MKSTTTYPFMVVHNQYYTSNSLNSIAYSAIHPTALGLLTPSVKAYLSKRLQYGPRNMV